MTKGTMVARIVAIATGMSGATATVNKNVGTGAGVNATMAIVETAASMNTTMETKAKAVAAGHITSNRSILRRPGKC